MIQSNVRVDSDAKALVDLMKSTAVGEMVTWEQMSKCIGRDIQKCVHVRTKAERNLRDEYRMVFATVRGEGVQRMSDIEVVDSSDKDREKMRRQSRRSMKRLSCANYDALPREKQVKHNAAVAVMGVLLEMATNKSLTSIERKIEETGSQLPTAKAALAALNAIS